MVHKLSIYEHELVSKGLVQPDKIRYMVWWIRRFLALGQPEESQFTDYLENEGRQDWQIRQAPKASSYRAFP